MHMPSIALVVPRATMPLNSLSRLQTGDSDADPASAPVADAAFIKGKGASVGGEPTLLSQTQITGPADLEDTC